MKISIVTPVYYNEDNLKPLYKDINEKLFCHTEYEWEFVLVNEGKSRKAIREEEEKSWER